MWVVVEEEQQLELEIPEFLASLVPEEEYQLGLEIKDTKEGSQASQESITSWTESIFQLRPFTFQQLLKSKSYEQLVLHVWVFVPVCYVNKNVL